MTYNARFAAGFGAYVEWLMRRSFDRVQLRAAVVPFPASGYVAVANHSSWWDGFAALLLHRVLAPKRPFAVMMAHDQLRRFPFFRMVGAFPVENSSARTALPAISAATALAAAGAGVWIFPQGALLAASTPLRFTSGFAHVAEAAGVPIVPVAMRYFFRARQRPDLVLAYGPALRGRARDTRAAAVGAVQALLASLDADYAAGTSEDGYASIVRARPGIDDVTSRLTKFVTRRR